MNSKLIIPDLGVDAAEVVEIAVKVGDSIQAEQDILTLETDKASMEVPASVGGTISELTIAVGDSVTSGQTIGQVVAGSTELSVGSTELPVGSAELYSAGKEQGKTKSTESPGSAELFRTRPGKTRGKPKAPHPTRPKKTKSQPKPPPPSPSNSAPQKQPQPNY